MSIFVVESREVDQQFSIVFRKYLLFNIDERLFCRKCSFLSVDPFCAVSVTPSSCGQKLEKYSKQMSNFTMSYFRTVYNGTPSEKSNVGAFMHNILSFPNGKLPCDPPNRHCKNNLNSQLMIFDAILNLHPNIPARHWRRIYRGPGKTIIRVPFQGAVRRYGSLV